MRDGRGKSHFELRAKPDSSEMDSLNGECLFQCTRKKKRQMPTHGAHQLGTYMYVLWCAYGDANEY